MADKFERNAGSFLQNLINSYLTVNKMNYERELEEREMKLKERTQDNINRYYSELSEDRKQDNLFKAEKQAFEQKQSLLDMMNKYKSVQGYPGVLQNPPEGAVKGSVFGDTSGEFFDPNSYYIPKEEVKQQTEKPAYIVKKGSVLNRILGLEEGTKVPIEHLAGLINSIKPEKSESGSQPELIEDWKPTALITSYGKSKKVYPYNETGLSRLTSDVLDDTGLTIYVKKLIKDNKITDSETLQREIARHTQEKWYKGGKGFSDEEIQKLDTLTEKFGQFIQQMNK